MTVNSPSLERAMGDRSDVLARAARSKREAARERAAGAIRQLERERQPITFKAVAARAHVSRQWLYTQPDLRQEIERLRRHQTDAGQASQAGERASRASLQQRVELLLEENRRLRAEITDLKAELAIAHGQRRAEH
jgi:hypothetical protein